MVEFKGKDFGFGYIVKERVFFFFKVVDLRVFLSFGVGVRILFKLIWLLRWRRR